MIKKELNDVLQPGTVVRVEHLDKDRAIITQSPGTAEQRIMTISRKDYDKATAATQRSAHNTKGDK